MGFAGLKGSSTPFWRKHTLINYSATPISYQAIFHPRPFSSKISWQDPPLVSTPSRPVSDVQLQILLMRSSLELARSKVQKATILGHDDATLASSPGFSECTHFSHLHWPGMIPRSRFRLKSSRPSLIHSPTRVQIYNLGKKGFYYYHWTKVRSRRVGHVSLYGTSRQKGAYRPISVSDSPDRFDHSLVVGR